MQSACDAYSRHAASQIRDWPFVARNLYFGPLFMQRLLLVMTAIQRAGGVAWSALWTFPSILASAFLIAWAAESAQFMISQGLALAILAWLQTLPEFAVEAVIAWEAGKDPERAHLAIANFTGAIRLLLGLGWPMIYFVAAFSAMRSRRQTRWAEIQLDDEHAIEVVCLSPPLIYFLYVWYKGNLSLIDAGVLIVWYLVYLGILWRVPPRSEETLDDVGRVPRAVLRLKTRMRWAAIIGLFSMGGMLLYFTAHPFLESMLALAVAFGVSQFVFVQWVAPFLSEFPEKVSAFYWARKLTGAPMALMNMVSSNINQWTVLAAMIPIVYSASVGSPSALPFDGVQRTEILITILQSMLGVLILSNMRFAFWEASLLFVLWFAQFLFPHLREEVSILYAIWMLMLVVDSIADPTRWRAQRLFLDLIRRKRG
jgi:cation:H+ antiporter